ncbi:bola-like protein [Xylariales sp. AK1849]|nr:bola-like protein [Xylariales sp. AK1849]
MICQRCRRVATMAAHQTKSLPPRAQSSITPVISLARISSYSKTTLRLPRVYSSRYYTSSGAPAASSPEPSKTPEKPDYLDDAESAIWDKLTAELSPTELMVQDVSGGCGSMYGIEIASEKFRGVNMLKQQRMVNTVLGDQMKAWHGVQLRTKVPS